MCTLKAPKQVSVQAPPPPPPAADPYLAPDAPGASGATTAVSRARLRINGGSTGAPAASPLGIKASTIGVRG